MSAIFLEETKETMLKGRHCLVEWKAIAGNGGGRQLPNLAPSSTAGIW
jgi:hypothetical protein